MYYFSLTLSLIPLLQSTLNTTIAMEDEESFVPCNPAPVNNRLLKELETRGPRATEARHLALTYGVLAAYAEYTEGLLEDVSSLPPHVAKKLTTVFEMLQSVIQLFTDVVSTITNTNKYQSRTYINTSKPTYNDTNLPSVLIYTDRSPQLHKQLQLSALRVQRPPAVHSRV